MATKKPTNNQIGWLVGGLAAVGLSVGGLSLASKNAELENQTNVTAQQEYLINFPAVISQQQDLREDLEAEKSETEREFELLEDSINEQINRREVEMRAERNEAIRKLERELDRIVKLIDILVNEQFELTP